MGAGSRDKREAAMRITLADAVAMSNESIRYLFAQARWGEHPRCPRCESVHLYTLASRANWKCKECKYHFSITSGTVLASGKMPLRTALIGVLLFLSGAKGISSLQLSRMLGCQYKTAFVFAHKIRDTLMREQASLPTLTGQVEIDGAFFGGHLKRFNYIDKRTGLPAIRRRYEHRRVIVVARERGGRTRTTVVNKESEAFPFICQGVSTKATIHADLAKGWDNLQHLYSMMRINHLTGFSIRGACTNQAESYFALMRRKQMGVHHRMSGANLDLYAAEMAWRNDHKRRKPDELAFQLLRELLNSGPSRRFLNYWQRSAYAAG